MRVLTKDERDWETIGYYTQRTYVKRKDEFE